MSRETRLKAEIEALQKTAALAAKSTFLPATARDAIVQACFVITTMASEIEQLRAQIASTGDTVNGQLGEMRQQLADNIVVVR